MTCLVEGWLLLFILPCFIDQPGSGNSIVSHKSDTLSFPFFFNWILFGFMNNRSYVIELLTQKGITWSSEEIMFKQGVSGFNDD